MHLHDECNFDDRSFKEPMKVNKKAQTNPLPMLTNMIGIQKYMLLDW